MGLDMYLDKVKKVDDLTLNQILATATYAEYLDNEKMRSKYTFDEYSRHSEDTVVKSAIDDVKNLYHFDNNPAWAEGIDDYKSSFKTISDNVAYWRKANAIHKWFVDNIQDGVDDCGSYEVTKEQLMELHNTALDVLRHSQLVPAKITNGYTYKDGKEIANIVDGETIEDASRAQELLPSQSGFFFGSTDYDEWYYRDIERTVNQLEKVINNTDFDKEIVYYSSSW